MGDSPITNTIKNVAGYGVGTLAALDTIKGGGLGSYLMNRQRLMSDPGFRSTLAGSPFAAGVFGVSGETGAAPAPAPPGAYPSTGAGGGAVVQPADMVGPPPPGVQVAQPGMPVPSASNVPGYEPGTPRAWMPNLPPYDPEQALKQQGFATSQIGLGSPDEGVRAQSKMAAGIPLTDPEMAAAVGRGLAVQKAGGPGAVVQLDIPGMKTNIGSPYNISAYGSEEYPTEALATAAASARGPGYHAVPSGRGTWLVAPPPTAEQQRPTQLDQPVRPPAPTAPTQPAAPAPAPASTPVQPAAPVTAPVAAPPPPPPPAPARAAAPPSGPPMASAGAPQTFATPGMGPAYRPPGLPDMAPSVPVAPGSPPGGQIGHPSAAFDDTSAAAPAPPPAPPPAQPLAQYARPVAASGGRVDLNAPWLRQLEVTRNLPLGTLSGMAEKESGGNALKVNPAPNSTAAGLFQITAPTAQAWGMTPADRFDPVKSATVTADILAQRAQSVGIERAVGMHYGGPGTPYNQVVGSSGLSPAAYSGDVLARAQKYTGATDGTVAYPSPAPAAPTPVDYRGLPFRQTYPDLTRPALGLPPPPAFGAALAAPGGVGRAAGPLAEPKTEVPLTTIHVTDQSGRDQTYAVPTVPGPKDAVNMQLAGIDDFRTAPEYKLHYFKDLTVADQAQEKALDADITRARGATPAQNQKAQVIFNNYRGSLDQLLSDFPNPEDRAKYVGWTTRGAKEIKTLIATDPQFDKFLTDVDQFQNRSLDDTKGVLSDEERQDLGNLLPTGREYDAMRFETKLQQFNDRVNSQLGILNAQTQMAPNEMDTAWWNAVRQQHVDQMTADKQAQGGRVGGAYVGAALGAPAAAAPPEQPPPTVIIAPPPAAPPPTTPPPFTVLGHWQE